MAAHDRQLKRAIVCKSIGKWDSSTGVLCPQRGADRSRLRRHLPAGFSGTVGVCRTVIDLSSNVRSMKGSVAVVGSPSRLDSFECQMKTRCYNCQPRMK